MRISAPDCLQERPLIDNNGTLVLESSGVSEVQYDYGDLISNHGDLTIRNTSIANNTNHGYGYGALLAIGPAGTVISVEHATIAANVLGPLGVFHADTVPGKGPLRIANSILNAAGEPVCYLSLDVVQVVSLGGNIVSDNTCALPVGDRIVVDSGLGAFEIWRLSMVVPAKPARLRCRPRRSAKRPTLAAGAKRRGTRRLRCRR